jgi:hypothetical protein
VRYGRIGDVPGAMVSDIAVDCYAVLALDHERVVTNVRLDGILLFGVFIFVTCAADLETLSPPTAQRL